MLCQSLILGLAGKKDYEDAAFCRREFEVPASWKGRVVRLQFDAVNFRSEVWLNDKVVGMHEGGFTPFSFESTIC